MGTFKVKESKFGAPEGIYIGRFLGIAPMRDDKPRIGRDGKPMAPGVEWQFEITEDPDHDGGNVGQIVGRITSATPTTKDACGTLLSGLVGHKVQPDEEIDPDPYKGQLYRIVIGPGKENPEKTQVIQIVRQKPGGATAVAPSRPAAPASQPNGTSAPPRPAGPAKPPTPAGPAKLEQWLGWDEPSQKLVEMSREQVQTVVDAAKDPAQVPLMHPDKRGEWKTAADFGFVATAF